MNKNPQVKGFVLAAVCFTTSGIGFLVGEHLALAGAMVGLATLYAALAYRAHSEHESQPSSVNEDHSAIES